MTYRKRCLADVGVMGGVPMVFTDFAWSLLQMCQFNSEYALPDTYVNYIKSQHSLHFTARNYLANEMISDLLLMLDTDHLFEPDILSRMTIAMGTLNVPVITAAYVHKGYPYSPVLFNFDENDEPRQIVSWKGPPIIDANCAGAGSLLIKREVFDRIHNELHEEPFDHIGKLGEDFSFFLRCKRLGIKCKALLFVESYHLEIRPVGLAHYQMPKPENNPEIKYSRISGICEVKLPTKTEGLTPAVI